jgi:CheY-like chemotaxis protein
MEIHRGSGGSARCSVRREFYRPVSSPMSLHGHGVCIADRVAHDPLLLIVDDNAELRGTVKELLSGTGIRVIEAGDGYEGVRKAYECHPDLIVMDIDLPGIDGCEATRLLKRQAATRDIPVVGLTGQAFLMDEARAQKRGFLKFLSKASDPDVLLEELESALGAAA